MLLWLRDHPPLHSFTRRIKTPNFFGRPKTLDHYHVAQSALAQTGTQSTHAPKRSYGMVAPILTPNETNPKTWSASSEGISYAPDSNPLVAVPSPIQPTHHDSDTNVQHVETPRMAQPAATWAPLPTKAYTPYNPDAWADQLSFTSLSYKYPTLVESIRNGFNAGIPPISTTFTPQNSSSIDINLKPFLSIISKEFSSKCYFGPFSRASVESLIGPFQTSPLSLVPKSSKNTWRLIQNLSFPLYPSLSDPKIHSINFHINADNFPCTWGIFHIVSLLILSLPPGSQACVRDVSEAYRTIPLHPSQWPGTVVRLNEDLFAINTAACFGLTSAGGIWGHLADALADILRAHGIGPLSKWVDDFFFCRLLKTHILEYNRQRALWKHRISAAGGKKKIRSRIYYSGINLPNGTPEEFDEDMAFPLKALNATPMQDHYQYAYSTRDINDITSPLGVHWAAEKDSDWSSTPTFVGFIWDIEKKTVTLTEKKREKYLEAITQLCNCTRLSLQNVQSLHGKLMHCTYILPNGRAYLTELESMFPAFRDRPLRMLHPPRRLAEDLQWWKNQLRQPIPPVTKQP